MIFSIRNYKDCVNQPKVNKELYRTEFFKMMQEFFSSSAVLINSPDSNFVHTIEELDKGNPFFDIYIFETESGEIAGYAAITKTYSNEAGGTCFWFDEIYIRKAYRGQHLGGTFVKKIIDENPQVKRFRLDVEKENEAAVHLYKKLGFKLLGYDQFIIDR